MITKNELQDAFMESFNLHEGNRRAKQLLYNKNNPNLSVADALLELLYTRYDTIGDSEWFAELNKYKNVFSKSHIYIIYQKILHSIYSTINI